MFYGDRSKPLIEVACFKNHLFKYEKTVYTGYSIRNYEAVKDLHEWWDIVGKNGERFVHRPERAKLSSLELVILTFRLDKFEESTRYLRYPKYNHRAVLMDELIPQEQRPFHWHKKDEYESPMYIFADIECATGGEKHVPIISGYCTQDGDFRQFIGDDCIELMFDNVVHDSNGCSDVFVLFHNLKYDWAVLSPQLQKISSICKKNNQLYACTIYHKRRKIVLRDSFKLISKPLRDFQKMFQLPEGKKEAIPYDYYTVDNILLDKMIPIDDIKSFFKLEDDKVLFEQILTDEFEDLTAYP